MVCNLTIGPRTSRSANRLRSYYLTYLPYGPIEPYEPIYVGSQSSHQLCLFQCFLVSLLHIYIDRLPAFIEGVSNCSLYSLIHTLTKLRRAQSTSQISLESPTLRYTIVNQSRATQPDLESSHLVSVRNKMLFLK